jgi:hypothetical protein
MGTKSDPGEYDCYAAAASDEPVFTLRANNKFTPTLIWLWASLSELDGEDPKKVAEARSCVTDSLRWAKEHDRPVAGLGQATMGGVLELIRTVNGLMRNADGTDTDDDVLRRFLSQTEFEK